MPTASSRQVYFDFLRVRQPRSTAGFVGGIVTRSTLREEYAPAVSEPFDRLENGGVRFYEHKMEIGRPYPFALRGTWLIAIRKSDAEGDVTFYKPE